MIVVIFTVRIMVYRMSHLAIVGLHHHYFPRINLFLFQIHIKFFSVQRLQFFYHFILIADTSSTGDFTS
jgi:hypothetical protein